jgi:hypothetical protein
MFEMAPSGYLTLHVDHPIGTAVSLGIIAGSEILDITAII